MDDKLVTETSLSHLPETKSLIMLLSSGKMNGAIDRERKGRCVHVSACVCMSLCTHAVCKN